MRRFLATVPGGKCGAGPKTNPTLRRLQCLSSLAAVSQHRGNRIRSVCAAADNGIDELHRRRIQRHGQVLHSHHQRICAPNAGPDHSPAIHHQSKRMPALLRRSLGHCVARLDPGVGDWVQCISSNSCTCGYKASGSWSRQSQVLSVPLETKEPACFVHGADAAGRHCRIILPQGGTRHAGVCVAGVLRLLQKRNQ